MARMKLPGNSPNKNEESSKNNHYKEESCGQTLVITKEEYISLFGNSSDEELSELESISRKTSDIPVPEENNPNIKEPETRGMRSSRRSTVIKKDDDDEDNNPYKKKYFSYSRLKSRGANVESKENKQPQSTQKTKKATKKKFISDIDKKPKDNFTDQNNAQLRCGNPIIEVSDCYERTKQSTKLKKSLEAKTQKISNTEPTVKNNLIVKLDPLENCYIRQNNKLPLDKLQKHISASSKAAKQLLERAHKRQQKLKQRCNAEQARTEVFASTKRKYSSSSCSSSEEETSTKTDMEWTNPTKRKGARMKNVTTCKRRPQQPKKRIKIKNSNSPMKSYLYPVARKKSDIPDIENKARLELKSSFVELFDQSLTKNYDTLSGYSADENTTIDTVSSQADISDDDENFLPQNNYRKPWQNHMGDIRMKVLRVNGEVVFTDTENRILTFCNACKNCLRTSDCLKCKHCRNHKGHAKRVPPCYERQCLKPIRGNILRAATQKPLSPLYQSNKMTIKAYPRKLYDKARKRMPNMGDTKLVFNKGKKVTEPDFWEKIRFDPGMPKMGLKSRSLNKALNKDSCKIRTSVSPQKTNEKKNDNNSSEVKAKNNINSPEIKSKNVVVNFLSPDNAMQHTKAKGDRFFAKDSNNNRKSVDKSPLSSSSGGVFTCSPIKTKLRSSTNTLSQPPNELLARIDFGVHNLVQLPWPKDDREDAAWENGHHLCLTTDGDLNINNLCFLCGSAGKEKMLTCRVCCENFHPYCLDVDPIDDLWWCCDRCKSCVVCAMKENLLMCDRCHDCYHPDCLGPFYQKETIGDEEHWMCGKCVKCVKCGRKTPGDSKTSRWAQNFTMCEQCGYNWEHGNYCPMCLGLYNEVDDSLKMMFCTRCEGWIHLECEGITVDDYELLADLPDELPYWCKTCTGQTKEAQPWYKECRKRLNDGFFKIYTDVVDHDIYNELCDNFGDNSALEEGMDEVLDKIQAYTLADVHQMAEAVSHVFNDTKILVKEEYQQQFELVDCRLFAQVNNLQTFFFQKLLEIFPWYSPELYSTSSKSPAKIRKISRFETPVPSEDHQYFAPKKFIPSDQLVTTTQEDTRRCLFCSGLGDGEGEGAGRLLYSGANEWVHVNCALWSAEVYEDDTGRLKQVYDAVKRGNKLKCEHCDQFGASVGCCFQKCQKSFHFLCAKLNNCVFLDDKKIYCHVHSSKANQHLLLEEGHMDVRRRVVVDMARYKSLKRTQKGTNPKQLKVYCGGFNILSLGSLTEKSDLKSLLVPVCFRVTKMFWSVSRPLQRCKYVCDVILPNETSAVESDKENAVDVQLESRTYCHDAHEWSRVKERLRCECVETQSDAPITLKSVKRKIGFQYDEPPTKCIKCDARKNFEFCSDQSQVATKTGEFHKSLEQKQSKPFTEQDHNFFSINGEKDTTLENKDELTKTALVTNSNDTLENCTKQIDNPSETLSVKSSLAPAPIKNNSFNPPLIENNEQKLSSFSNKLEISLSPINISKKFHQAVHKKEPFENSVLNSNISSSVQQQKLSLSAQVSAEIERRKFFTAKAPPLTDSKLTTTKSLKNVPNGEPIRHVNNLSIEEHQKSRELSDDKFSELCKRVRQDMPPSNGPHVNNYQNEKSTGTNSTTNKQLVYALPQISYVNRNGEMIPRVNGILVDTTTTATNFTSVKSPSKINHITPIGDYRSPESYRPATFNKMLQNDHLPPHIILPNNAYTNNSFQLNTSFAHQTLPGSTKHLSNSVNFAQKELYENILQYNNIAQFGTQAQQAFVQRSAKKRIKIASSNSPFKRCGTPKKPKGSVVLNEKMSQDKRLSEQYSCSATASYRLEDVQEQVEGKRRRKRNYLPALTKLLQEEEKVRLEKSNTGLKFVLKNEQGWSAESSSIEEIWKRLLNEINETRLEYNITPLNFNPSDAYDFMGASKEYVSYLVEQLPGGHKCRSYRFQHHLPCINDENEDLPINKSGCARSEINVSKAEKDMFAWLASPYRLPPKQIENEIEPDVIYGAQELPTAMKYRLLKSLAKDHVGVYRSTIHGRGLFCKKTIEAGEMIIEYSGETIRASLTDSRENYYDKRGYGCYMFRIDSQLVVDATMRGNAARFINHSCEPNCFSRIINVDGGKKIVIFALKRVSLGEELTYDYKFALEDDKLPCYCGAKKCRKYLN